jgi:hypothetical protein
MSASPDLGCEQGYEIFVECATLGPEKPGFADACVTPLLDNLLIDRDVEVERNQPMKGNTDDA